MSEDKGFDFTKELGGLHGVMHNVRTDKNEILQSSAAARGICEVCGREFKQTWSEKKGRYSQFKVCRNCHNRRISSENKHGKDYLYTELPYVPHDGQKLVHESDKRFRLIAAGTRWGKDRCSMMEFILKFSEMLSEDRDDSLVPKVHGWFIAPTYKMARNLWMEFKSFFPAEWVINFWETEKMIETVNDGIIEIRSADDPKSLVGVGLDIVIVTEAARIMRLEEVWPNIEDRLMSPGRGPGGKGGIALINSTPTGRNFFYRMFRWGQKEDQLSDQDWESWTFPSWTNPYLNLKDKDYLERIKKRYPERVYRQEILAEFIAETNSVFPKADSCANYIGDAKRVPGEVYTIGYDPAKEVDYSAVVVRNSLGEAVHIDQWTGVPWPAQIEKIVALSRYYNYARVVIDKTGLGQTLPSMISANGVVTEEVTLSNIEKERLVNHLAMLIEQETISYPDNEVLLNELKDYQYSYTKTGKISFSASSYNKHDDLVIAMVLAFKDYNMPGVVLPFMGMVEGIKKKKTRTA